MPSRSVWLVVLVWPLPGQGSDLVSDYKFVSSKVVNNLWSSLCPLSQLNCPGISDKKSFTKIFPIVLNLLGYN